MPEQVVFGHILDSRNDTNLLRTEPHMLFDGAGNKFISERRLVGNDSKTYVTKFDPHDQIMNEWVIWVDSAQDKTDGSSITQRGSDLYVLQTAHTAIVDPNRPKQLSLAVLSGVCVPFSGQAPPGGGQGTGNVDIGAIVALVQEELLPVIDQRIAAALATHGGGSGGGGSTGGGGGSSTGGGGGSSTGGGGGPAPPPPPPPPRKKPPPPPAPPPKK